MAYVICDPCIGTCDTACVEVCPCDVIHGPLPLEEARALPPEERAARGLRMYIDPDGCIDCGACAPVCPVEAIFLDADVPPAFRPSIEANATFFLRRTTDRP